MANNQRLFLIVIAIGLILFAITGIFGLCWYVWGRDGIKVALYLFGGTGLLFFGWFIVMGSINSVSNIYRDAAMTIVEFQAADDRGEVMRHMATMVKSGNQLDKTVLSLAGNLAKGQARALTDSHHAQQQQAQQQAIETEWWNVPSFEVDNG